MNSRYPIAPDDASPVLGNEFSKGICHLLAAANEAVLSVDVEHVDEGMDVGGRVTFHSAVHGVHVGQQVT